MCFKNGFDEECLLWLILIGVIIILICVCCNDN